MDLNKYVEHTLLKQDATREEVIKLLDEAKTYGFLGVCVNPCNVAFANEYLKNTEIKIVTVILATSGIYTVLNILFKMDYAKELLNRLKR